MAASELATTRSLLQAGMVIPAHPLALTPARRLDERYQRALTRYYLAAGAGGLAVGVHTTQFEIHDPKVGLLQPVLELAAEESNNHAQRTGASIVLVGGICGPSDQAIREARLLVDLRYHAGLVSLGALRDATDDELIDHCRAIAEVIPLFGFYLQAAVGGRPLSYAFWRRFFEIDRVVAVKIAPFNRYQTIDVARALAESGREDVALYTGNDDAILLDLMTPHSFPVGEEMRTVRMVGGLLGQWAVWTERAVQIWERTQAFSQDAAELLKLHAQLTDANSAVFDVANHFHGCIAGIHEVLRGQGLLPGIHLLDGVPGLSPGQQQEIDRVRRSYPHLCDDAFVHEHLDSWLA